MRMIGKGLRRYSHRVRGHARPYHVGVDARGQAGAIDAFGEPVEAGRVDEAGNAAEQIGAPARLVRRHLSARYRLELGGLTGFGGRSRHGDGLDRLRLDGGPRRRRVAERHGWLARWRRRRPGFAAPSSVIASRAASPVRLNPADLPEPSKDAVLSASKPVSPPHPDRDAAIRTAAMRVACTIRLRHYVRTTKGDQASVPGDSSPSEKTVKILISPEQPARFGGHCG